MIPSTAPEANWSLVELRADGSHGPSHRLAGDVVEIGRRGRDIAEPDDEQMADHHASLVYETDEWFLADSGEGSGVWLRIEAQEPWPLEDKDQIWLGAQILVVGRPRDAWNLTHFGPDGQLRKSYAIGENGIFVGRGSDSELDLDDGLLSRRHAQFCFEDGVLVVVDRGARNGTFVKVSGATPLRPGSQFRVATKVYRLQSGAAS